MKMRIIGAILLVLVMVPVIVLGGNYFAVTMAILGILGLYELLLIRETKTKFPFLLKIASYIFVCLLVISNMNAMDFQYDMDYRVLASIFFVFLAPVVLINDNKKYNFVDAMYLICALLFVGFSFNLLVVIRNYSLAYIVYLLLITTMTDTFALFTGMFIGKHKFAPQISPKKTIEGAIGGSLMGTFIATVFYITVINSNISLALVVLCTFVLTAVGQLGDLAFSSIKRYFGKKDFSNIIPGHGGILDRFDSIIFVVLIFILIFGII